MVRPHIVIALHWGNLGTSLVLLYIVIQFQRRDSEEDRSLMLDAYKVEEECLILSHFVYLQKNDHLTRYHDCQVEQAGSECDRFIVLYIHDIVTENTNIRLHNIW